MIPLTIKRAIARNIGKNLELCKEAFEEGRKQGLILVDAQKAKDTEANNKPSYEDTVPRSV
tara:strand:+ start:92 stop:274 length:183 start_codon:yes stop_codon:yes gene_type:complete